MDFFRKSFFGASLFLALFAVAFFSSQAEAAGPTFASGTISTDTTWTVTDSPFVVSGILNINSGVTLTVNPGVIVKFASGSAISVLGTLNAQGVSGQEVIFTSLKDDSVGGDTNNDGGATAPAPGDWRTIRIPSAGGAINLSRSVVRFGGLTGFSPFGALEINNGVLSVSDSQINQNIFANIRVINGSAVVNNSEIKQSDVGIRHEGGSLAVNQSTIRDNSGDGILGLFPAPNLSVLNTSFENNDRALFISPQTNFTHSNITAVNNNINGIVMSGVITGNRVWSPDSPIPYVVSSDGGSSIIIQSGVSLTINPGTVVKFLNPGSLIGVIGTLNVQGTASNPVFFTSIKDDTVGGDTNNDGSATTPTPGDWQQISLNFSTSLANIDNAVIRFGGSTAGLGFGAFDVQNGNLSITNSKINDNLLAGVRMRLGAAATATVVLSEINNNDNGIIQEGGSVNISSSTIRDNLNFGILNAFNAPPTTAINNFWGDPSGPFHPTLNVSGAGNQVSNRVDFIPFLGSDPLAAPPPSPPDTNIAHNSAPSSLTALLSQEPVNTLFGNYLRQETDLLVPGRGIPLEFTRTYNSLSGFSGSLGEKWLHNYEVRLKIATTSVIIVNEDGREDLYVRNGNSFTPQNGVFDQLVQNQDNTFALTRKNQTILNLNSQGVLQNLKDRNNNTNFLSYDGFGRLTSVTDPTGRSLTFTYDLQNRITFLTNPAGKVFSFAYTVNNELASVSNPESETTQYQYDANHQLTKIIDANNNVVVENTYQNNRVVFQKDGLANQTTFQYFNSPTSTVITDPEGATTTHVYDSDFRISQIIDALGGVTAYTYDTDDNRTSITDPNNHTTFFAYDGNGNLTQLTDPLANTLSFTYDVKNNLTSATNAKGDTTTFQYDTNGNLTKITDALGNETDFTYNSFGQLTQKQDPKGNITAFQYDSNGNLNKITDVLGSQISFSYDSLSRLLNLTDALNNTAQAQYDDVGRLLKTIDPLNNQTSFTYDNVGNLVKIKDAKSQETTYTYDPNNNLIQVIDADNKITAYGYDQNNNRTAIIDANNHITAYQYDRLNRLATTTDPLGNTTRFTYDSVGNIVNLINGKGEIIAFEYDADNRFIKKIFPGNILTTFGYDQNGNITQAQNPDVAYTFAYDALNRLTQFTDSRFPAASIYAYDQNGNRTRLQTFLNASQVASTTYAYDVLNRLSRITDQDNDNHNFTYDQLSRRTRLDFPNGVKTDYSYDSADRLLSLIYKNPANQVLEQFIYTYDSIGNRLTKETKDEKLNYNYDVLSRLLSVTDKKNKIEQYSYDPVGNRVAGLKPQHTFSYNPANELVQFRNTFFAYDQNGNLAAETKDDEIRFFSYDPENRLIQVNKQEQDDNNAKPIAEYKYDPFGRRIEKKADGKTERFFYDNEDILFIDDGKHGIGRSIFVHGPGIDEPLSITQIKKKKSEKFFYEFDGLGSVISLTDIKGKVVEKYDYDSFGNLKGKGQGKIKQSYAYTGREFDQETGLYYYRARYYDSRVGRFVNKDLQAGFILNPSTFNVYVYTLNNPIKFIDPSGFTPVPFSSDVVPELLSFRIQNLDQFFSDIRAVSVNRQLASLLFRYFEFSTDPPRARELRERALFECADITSLKCEASQLEAQKETLESLRRLGETISDGARFPCTSTSGSCGILGIFKESISTIKDFVEYIFGRF